MFVPHEAIYLDLLERDLIEYAFGQKKVIIVSPTNFLAYLQTVLQGLRALTIEESAKEIRARVEQLSRHLLSYEQYMNKLGNHLGTTVGAYNSASKEFVKIDKDVLKITGASNSPEPLTLDRPQQE
jgi:DNA recombination protein RmuC